MLTITLNRPDVLNAFNAAMHEALGAALEEAADASVRAVVLTGAGRGFCVGQDLTEFREAPGDIGEPPARRLPPERARDPRAREAGDRRRQRRRPPARASRSRAPATSGSPPTRRASCPAFINIGLIPDSGGTYFISRLLGYARAFEWMTSGRKLSARPRRTRWGLVSEVVEGDGLAARAAELAAAATPRCRRAAWA